MDGARWLFRKIRADLQHLGAAALLVPHTDAFLSEYLTPDCERLAALTGFTGSAGLAIITQNAAVLFTDARYTDQAAQQTDFQVLNIAHHSPVDWMKTHLTGQTVLFHAGTLRAGLALSLTDVLQKSDIHFKPMDENLIDRYWQNRPVAPMVHEFNYPLQYAGASCPQKIQAVLKKMKTAHISALIVSDVESVSWLLNRRSDLSSYLPVVRRRVVLTMDGKIHALSKRVLNQLKEQTLGVDLNTLPFDVYQQIQAVANVCPLDDPIAALRAVKNQTEQAALRTACLFESAVICTFIDTLYRQKDALTECSAGCLLQKLRQKNPLYLGDSFTPIVAVGGHAALAHYQADLKSDVPLVSAPMVLVDTGGQYLNGTTDMTRTLCMGKPTPVMKKRYTQVLKGHIALAQTVLQVGETPAALDVAARQFLRADGADYGHATGHGIGMCLSVHDKMPTIYEKSQTLLESGMVFSNEPAFYDNQNGFGIRLENMLLTHQKGRRLFFENLIWAPFEPALLDVSLLSDSDKQWLRQYHAEIEERVFPLLKPSVARRLKSVIDFFKDL